MHNRAVPFFQTRRTAPTPFIVYREFGERILRLRRKPQNIQSWHILARFDPAAINGASGASKIARTPACYVGHIVDSLVGSEPFTGRRRPRRAGAAG